MLDGVFGGMRLRGLPGEAGLATEGASAGGGILENHLTATEERLDKLILLCTAMWSLLKEQTHLTEEQLFERVRQLDLADGVQDGKVTQKVAKCEKCGRVMSFRHSRCLYCGAERLVATPFESLF